MKVIDQILLIMRDPSLLTLDNGILRDIVLILILILDLETIDIYKLIILSDHFV